MSGSDGKRPRPTATLPAASRSGPSIARPAQGLVLAGRYKLEETLGSGGMGEVFRAEHLKLGVPVAVKIMHDELAANDDLARRFQREARATSQIDHPNVVRVLDAGEDAGLFYIVMEYLHGESLDRWLGELEVPPPLAEVAHVLGQVLDALGAAHAAGIVHRDLKPDNVFTEMGPDGRRQVTVVDFGLAHFDDQHDPHGTLTKTDMVAGTPQYMSPEQCHSLAVSPSSDLYSVGCILTDLLQLRPPFTGTVPIQVITQQLFLPPAPLDRPAGSEPVPPLLERLRLDLLAKTPEGRPRDAAEARRRLVEAMSPEATAKRLPARKGDEPLGGRLERVPAWTLPPGPAEAPMAPSAAALVEGALVRLAGAQGVGGECVTGVAAQGVLLREEARDASVVVLDAGRDVAGALAWLADRAQAGPLPKVVLCVAELSAATMSALIAAGAADFVAYPVSADALGRKVNRIVRRGR